MKTWGGATLSLGLACLLAFALAVAFGETALTTGQWREAVLDPWSGPADVLWRIRAPRALCALCVGAALGAGGAVMQGLLRNPLAEPGVLGVSAGGGAAAALAIVAGLAVVPGAVELAAIAGAGLVAAALLVFVGRVSSPAGLILFGVALSSLGAAGTALVFNLAPTPLAAAEVMAWLMGSVENRGWTEVLWIAVPTAVAGWLAHLCGPGLRALALGEDTARTLGLSLDRLRLFALLSASLAAGAAVAVAGAIGFVGLVGPHLVRRFVRDDPARLWLPSGLAGGLILVLADLTVRVIPTEQELKLGVVTSLIGAPLFALIAARAARSWRS
ncbi:MAG TPA: iron ABC transporter permease [Brevundimonas sp.]|jgi:iron complex transport system permease protein|uniref:FecCD family ABC transporter permease n=1 Tax=Brevundimonas sp. TaxID=1871086 RepID=UPI002DE31CA7|nr:iron ABC transporter permease [Brevundimonas sp.]